MDLDVETATVLLLGERGYEEATTYWKGQVLTSPTLEGLAIDLNDVFRA